MKESELLEQIEIGIIKTSDLANNIRILTKMIFLL